MPDETLTAESIFRKYFAKLYPEQALADLDQLRRTDANPGNNPAIAGALSETAEVFAALAPKLVMTSNDADPLVLDFSDRSVHQLAMAVGAGERARLGAGTGDDLIKLVTHGAIYVGECVVRNHGGKWLARRPLWESLVRLASPAGIADLALFQWWLKSLSDDEIEQPRLGDRYRTHVEIPCFDVTRLKKVAPADRKLPTLKQVRYDTLHKYLRAHLPEMKDLGADFPSPERFADFGFRQLSFRLIGDGRMLLMHGPTKTGLQLFWLDSEGFSKSAHYPADREPEHRIETDGDILRVVVPIGGKLRTHEMLWWGA